jgi:N-acetylneuraminate lyase
MIHGLKYTSYDLLNLRSIIDACGPELIVFAGPDEMLLPILAMGATGGIGATYNCVPELYVGLYQAWQEGDILRAQSLQFDADRLIRAMAPYGIISATKAVMNLLGLDCGNPRPPLLPLEAGQVDSLKYSLQALGLFDRALLKIQK